jgi:solute carrier family 25 (mitochondrial uncoupling protein), member 8/9
MISRNRSFPTQVLTIPIDTTKVRLQILKKSANANSNAVPTSMLGMMQTIVKEEGFRALYKGLVPAIHRQLLFASLRVGLYAQISAFFVRPGEQHSSLLTKILSGLVSGAVGITIASPTDLVKVRFQSDRILGPNQTPRYKGVFHAYSTIIKTEGFLGLWTGLGPNIIRNSIINSSELVAYDVAKEYLLLSLGLQDNFFTHFLSGAFAGLIATIIGNPVDVVKTRVMAGSSASAQPNANIVYKGALDCIVKTFQNEGILAFYQGVIPMFYRLTGWNILMFIGFEQCKAIARDYYQTSNKLQ